MSELLASHNQSVRGSNHPFKNKIEPDNVETASLASTSSGEFSFLAPIEPPLRRLSVSLGLQTKGENEDLDESIMNKVESQVRKIINSIPFRQRLWESFPTKAVGTLSNSLSRNISVVWTSALPLASIMRSILSSNFDRKA